MWTSKGVASTQGDHALLAMVREPDVVFNASGLS
jgi:hypothetical protein